MTVFVDTRDVVERAESAVRDAEFELQSGVEVRRCPCGATTLQPVADGFVCAGCGTPDLRPRPFPGEVLPKGTSGAQDSSPGPVCRVLGADNLNAAPLRAVERRDVLASRERLYLTCGHAVERACRRGGWALRVRCVECASEGSFR